jgi:hypothetical protein
VNCLILHRLSAGSELADGNVQVAVDNVPVTDHPIMKRSCRLAEFL